MKEQRHGGFDPKLSAGKRIRAAKSRKESVCAPIAKEASALQMIVMTSKVESCGPIRLLKIQGCASLTKQSRNIKMALLA